MKRNAIIVLVAGLVLFVIGAVGGPALGSDTAVPVWLATWLGLALVVAAIPMFIVGRRAASRPVSS